MMSAGWLGWAVCLAVVFRPAAAVEWLDLTYPFDNNTHYWPDFDRFNLTRMDFPHQEGFWLEMFTYAAPEHGGTHMDAPFHFQEFKWKLDEIPVERFVAHAAVLDVVDASQQNPDYEVSRNDLEQWKKVNGPWKYPTLLLVKTGNAQHWTNHTRYWGFGMNETNPKQMHFPGLGEGAAEILANDPNVVGVGLDTPSLDPGTSTTYPAHRILLNKNKYGLEHLPDMSRVPTTGATVIAAPMKIGGGTGGPCRVMVRLP